MRVVMSLVFIGLLYLSECEEDKENQENSAQSILLRFYRFTSIQISTGMRIAHSSPKALPGDGFEPVITFGLGGAPLVLFLEHAFHLLDAVRADQGVDPIGRGQLRRGEEFFAAVAGDGFFVFHEAIIP